MIRIRHTTVRSFLTYLLLFSASVVLIMPFVWIISTSLKGNESIFAIPPQWIPKEIHWENYAKVFVQMPFFTYLKNSVFISIMVILGTLLSSSLVAYAFACLKWPGRNGLFIFVLGTMMLPMQVTMIPVFVLFKQFGWLNTFKPLIVPAFFGGGAFNIFLLRRPS